MFLRFCHSPMSGLLEANHCTEPRYPRVRDCAACSHRVTVLAHVPVTQLHVYSSMLERTVPSVLDGLQHFCINFFLARTQVHLLHTRLYHPRHECTGGGTLAVELDHAREPSRVLLSP